MKHFTTYSKSRWLECLILNCSMLERLGQIFNCPSLNNINACASSSGDFLAIATLVIFVELEQRNF